LLRQAEQVTLVKEAPKMEWQIILALVLATPIILLPVAFIWYLNIGGIVAAAREARERKAATKEERIGAVTEQHQV